MKVNDIIEKFRVETTYLDDGDTHYGTERYNSFSEALLVVEKNIKSIIELKNELRNHCGRWKREKNAQKNK